MIVVDTSAVVSFVVDRRPPDGLVERITADGDLQAPHLLDVEVLHALRRLLSRGAMSLERAADARVAFAELAVTRYPHPPLADRAWRLRDDVTAYDGMFVALAETLDIPLVTCDGRLAAAPGVAAAIELFEPAA